MERYRSLSETVHLFKMYQYDFEKMAARETGKEKAAYYRGKADSYEVAAFEIEHNVKGAKA